MHGSQYLLFALVLDGVMVNIARPTVVKSAGIEKMYGSWTTALPSLCGENPDEKASFEVEYPSIFCSCAHNRSFGEFFLVKLDLSLMRTIKTC